MNNDKNTNNEQLNLPAMFEANDLSLNFATLAEGEGAKIRHTTTTDDVTLFNALNGSAEKIEDFFGQDVVVTDIVVSSADLNEDINDPDSDKVNKPVVHFFTADGKHISSISNGIKRATENLLSVGFAPSAEAPITIRFKEVKTKKGTAHSFDLVSR